MAWRKPALCAVPWPRHEPVCEFEDAHCERTTDTQNALTLLNYLRATDGSGRGYLPPASLLALSTLETGTRHRGRAVFRSTSLPAERPGACALLAPVLASFANVDPAALERCERRKTELRCFLESPCGPRLKTRELRSNWLGQQHDGNNMSRAFGDRYNYVVDGPPPAQ